MSDLLEQLDELANSAKERISKGEDRTALRIEFLGRKGAFQRILDMLPSLTVEQKKLVGQKANSVKKDVARLLFDSAPLSKPQEIDLSLPIQLPTHGHEHPVQKTIATLYHIFDALGFSEFRTPEIETEEHNFDALRVPKDHPARDMQDTFWTVDGHVLHTHTTAFQFDAITQLKPPFAVMQGGKIYRAEAEDATHLSEFHQFDGFAVAEGLAFSDLKGLLFRAMRELFGPDTKIRFRPSFFPFVEPGAELDIECGHCHGKGCKSCGYKGWLEMLGCGMTHSDIIRMGGLDPKKYQGLAFGMGIERLTMIKYEIDDIREFTKNDPRFYESLT